LCYVTYEDNVARFAAAGDTFVEASRYMRRRKKSALTKDELEDIR
jgi:hypothetical protein